MSETYPTDLVSTAWLAEHLHDPKVRVIDATWFAPGGKNLHAEFAAKHIPGAVLYDLDSIAQPDTHPLPHMVPTPELFAEKVGALGIGNDDLVVAYDQHGLQTAARAWWMFRLYGHDTVAVLDGGFPKWLAEGRPVEAGEAKAEAKSFEAGFRPELLRRIDDIRANLDSKAEQLVDARSTGRFDGTGEETWVGRPAGHIPGSRNLPFGDLLDPATKTLLPSDVVVAKLEAAGLDLSKPVVATCGSGVTAAVVALGMALAGKRDVPIYDGSWAEWGLRNDLPMETGPARP